MLLLQLWRPSSGIQRNINQVIDIPTNAILAPDTVYDLCLDIEALIALQQAWSPFRFDPARGFNPRFNEWRGFDRKIGEIGFTKLKRSGTLRKRGVIGEPDRKTVD